jgi:protocatechuate 3,4-dioxygenase beta subunit
LGVAALALLGLLLATRPGRGDRAARPLGHPVLPPPGPPGAVEPPAQPEPEVPREQAIRGVVRDTADLPVAEAVVIAADRYEGATLARTRTAADGTFLLGPLEEAFVRVVAEHPERGVASGDVQPGDFLELWLRPGAAVTGTVRARDGGQPLADASVHVHGFVAKTDGQGRYSLRNLAPPPAQVIAVADGYRQARRTLTIAPGESRTLDFALDRGETLAGVVTDARTGAAIAGATVAERAHGYPGNAADRRVATDAEGRYVLEGVAAEPNRTFLCFAGGYVAAERESDGSGRLDFALERGLAAEGQVVDPDGRPVPDATVILHRVTEAGGLVFRGRDRSERTRTDRDGRFRFEDVVPGTVAFVAGAPGFAPGETAHLDTAALGDVLVRLAPGMTMEVTVRDADGLGVEGASVNTGPPAGMRDRLAGRERAAPRTDGEGRARIADLTPGDYDVSVVHARRGRVHARVSGKAGEVVPVALAFGGLEIAGRVVSARGDPAAGAWVSAFGPNHGELAEVDALGRFRVPGLPPGSYRLQARAAGGASAVTEVPAGAQGVELALASQALRGTVRGAEEGMLGSFEVRFQLKMPRVNMGCEVEGGDGRFEDHVPPGTYDVTARAPGYRPAVVRGIVVAAGTDPPPIGFVLEPAASVRGSARGRDGRPLPYVWVAATPTRVEDGLAGAQDRTDQEGRFLLDGLGAGTYAIVLNGGREGTTRAVTSVPATGTVALDLRLGPTGTAVVRVVDAEGKPVAKAYVTFHYAEHGALAGEAGLTGDEGTVASGPLPADVALVARALHVDRGRAEAPVTVTAGGRAEVRLDLDPATADR